VTRFITFASKHSVILSVRIVFVFHDTFLRATFSVMLFAYFVHGARGNAVG
jgi:hypothetical protein